ncbi:MAG: methylmalonyl Co-A mutase-associated GTPase MeaB [Desulfobacter sp.]
MVSVDELVAASLAGDKYAMSRLISLVEREDPHAPDILQAIYPYSGNAYRIGVTGPPGAGKSTLVNRLVQAFCKDGYAVGVIAVDPSSPFSGGALLGDRVRFKAKTEGMDCFFRSMSAGRALGGLARATRDAARVMDASGRQVIILETVGVGQSEMDIAKAADTVVVMLTPESGDDMQAMKAGLMEIADLFAVNKSDRPGADAAVQTIEGMLSRTSRETDWQPRVYMISAALNNGVRELYDGIWDHHGFLGLENRMGERRKARIRTELKTLMMAEFSKRLWEDPAHNRGLETALEKVWQREIDPGNAARETVGRWFSGTEIDDSIAGQ